MRRTLLSLGLLIIVGLFAPVLAVGLRLSSPRPAVIGPPPSILAGAEPVEIASQSGATLHGWHLPGRPGGGGVVLMHGIGGSRLQMVRRAAALHEKGFAVLLFDFQGHGESIGKRITFGHLEGRDAAAALGFLRGRLPNERSGVIGVSLGGAAALLGLEPSEADAMVLESVYPDIDAALANRLRTGLGPVVGPVATPILAPLFTLLLPPIIGVRPSDLRPIDRIGGFRTPMLIASGTRDRSTPLEEAQALFDRARAPKTFWAVRDAGHVDLEAFGSEEYWRHVLPFLTERLQVPQMR